MQYRRHKAIVSGLLGLHIQEIPRSKNLKSGEADTGETVFTVFLNAKSDNTRKHNWILSGALFT